MGLGQSWCLYCSILWTYLAPSLLLVSKVKCVSGNESGATRREFYLYWFGVFVLAFSFVGILLTISGLITDILSTQCYFPYVSAMLGVSQSSPPTSVVTYATTVNGTQPMPMNQSRSIMPPEQIYPPPYPYYCYANPVVAVFQFTFKLLSSLVFMGVGGYMVLNGKKR